jgi:hypothetical protein
MLFHTTPHGQQTSTAENGTRRAAEYLPAFLGYKSISEKRYIRSLIEVGEVHQ